MRNKLRNAVSLLATAAAIWLTRPAPAQTPSATASNFASAKHAEPDANALALPRVVPPPQPSSPFTSFIVPVSATTTTPAIDVLAAPLVPAAWIASPMKLVIPSGLSTAPPAKLSAPVVAASVLHPVPVVATVRPTLQPLAASKPPARSWPPAHLVRKNTDSQETRGVAYFEAAPMPQAPPVKPK